MAKAKQALATPAVHRGGGAHAALDWQGVLLLVSILLTVAIIGFYAYIFDYKHETHSNFSTLDEITMELTKMTEVALYYSFFKQGVAVESTSEWLRSFIDDARVELTPTPPYSLNPLSRMNLYPELILSAIYRSIGNGNLVEAHDFYNKCVFVMTGIWCAAIYWAGYVIGNRSIVCGLVSLFLLHITFEHNIRVQGSVSLREHFGGPILMIQFVLLSHILRQEDIRRQHEETQASSGSGKGAPFHALVLLGATSICSQMSWQFTQFVLLLQASAVFGTYIFGYLDMAATQRLFVAYLVIIIGNVVTQFGNLMIFYGFFSMVTLSVLLAFALTPAISNTFLGSSGGDRQKLLLVPMQVVVMLSCCMGFFFLKQLTIAALGLELDDDHILNFLKSKFTSHFDFDTLQYECQAVFVGMSQFEYDYFNERRVTYLGGVAVLLVSIVIARDLLHSILHVLPLLQRNSNAKISKGGNIKISSSRPPEAGGDHGERRHPEFVCHSFLAVALFLMAALLASRFKALFIPHLCIVASFCFNRPFYAWLVRKLLKSPLPGFASKTKADGSSNKSSSGLDFVTVALYVASLGGAAYLVGENYDLFLDSMQGEYSGGPTQFRSPDWRELVDFINVSGKVPEGTMWTGFMRTLGGLALTSKTIKITGNPHYEHPNSRKMARVGMMSLAQIDPADGKVCPYYSTAMFANVPFDL
jgi:hypothetical protein